MTGLSKLLLLKVKQHWEMFTPGQKQLGKWPAVKLLETNRLSSSIEGAMTALESVSRTNLNEFVSLSLVLLNFRN